MKIKYNKKILIIMILLLLVVGIGIGYAALRTDFAIVGRSEIDKIIWDVGIDGISVTEGSVPAIKEPTETSKNQIEYEVALSQPGQFYEFMIKVVNRGTMNARIDVLDDPSVQRGYLVYSIGIGNFLGPGETVIIPVRLEFKKDVTSSELPTTAETLHYFVDLKFDQMQ